MDLFSHIAYVVDKKALDDTLDQKGIRCILVQAFANVKYGGVSVNSGFAPAYPINVEMNTCFC